MDAEVAQHLKHSLKRNQVTILAWHSVIYCSDIEYRHSQICRTYRNWWPALREHFCGVKSFGTIFFESLFLFSNEKNKKKIGRYNYEFGMIRPESRRCQYKNENIYLSFIAGQQYSSAFLVFLYCKLVECHAIFVGHCQSRYG